MAKTFFTIILLCLGIFAGAATIDYNLDKPNPVLVGTPLTLNISINSAKGDTLYAPALDTLDVFIVSNRSQQEQQTASGTTTNLTLQMAAFDTGTQQLPALEFTVKNASGTQVLKTEPLTVEVQSVLPDSLRQQLNSQTPPQQLPLADIAGIRKIKLTVLDIAVPVFVVLALIFGIYFIIRALRKSKGIANNDDELIDTRPAWQIALEMLAGLKERRLIETNRLLDLYFGLSYIGRWLIERQYGFNAAEMTTSEIKHALKLPAAQKSDIITWLQAADAVKYAKGVTGQDAAQKQLEWLEGYIAQAHKQWDEEQFRLVAEAKNKTKNTGGNNV